MFFAESTVRTGTISAIDVVTFGRKKLKRLLASERSSDTNDIWSDGQQSAAPNQCSIYPYCEVYRLCISLRTDFLKRRNQFRCWLFFFFYFFFFLHPIVVVVCCKENKFGNTSPLDVEISGKSDGASGRFFFRFLFCCCWRSLSALRSSSSLCANSLSPRTALG